MERARNVRVVVAGEGETFRRRPSGTGVIEQLEQDKVDQLRIGDFRLGIHPTECRGRARDYGVQGGNVRETLGEFKKGKVLREFGGGIPSRCHSAGSCAIDHELPAARAKRHQAIGRTLAPYTVRHAMSGLSIESPHCSRNMSPRRTNTLNRPELRVQCIDRGACTIRTYQRP